MKFRVGICSLLLAGITFANPPWSPNVVACRVGGDTINEGESCIASDGNYIYCICNCNERNRVAVIPYGRSTDGGQTWTSTWWQDPSVSITWHTDPVLFCDDTGYLHMFIQFSTTVIRHYLSTDHGVTWCESTNVSSGGSVDKPWGCYYQNDLYLTWQNVGSNAGIYFAKSTDRGRTWNQRRIDANNTGITAICTSPSGIIYLANRNWGDNDVLFTRSLDQGATWAPWQTLATGCTYTSGYGDRAPLPAIAAPTDSHVVITWVDDRYGNWDILLTRTTDGGSTWTPFARLNDSVAGGQCKGWVCADPLGGLHFIWYHTPSWPTSASSYWSVRYQHSEDFGATISPSIRLSDTTFRSPVSFLGEYHLIVADSPYVRCVWTDGRNGDLDLFFAQAELSAIGVEENPFVVFTPPNISLHLPGLTRGSAVTVDYVLHRPAPVRLSVLDAAGRKLTSRDLGYQPAGCHRCRIPGLPANQPLFVKLDAGGTVTGRTMLIR